MLTALLTLVVFCGGVSVLSVSGRGAQPRQPVLGPTALARRDARDFLARYVAPNGRVVRHDEGGDTVSEGQGYALLIAVAIGDGTEFRRVWRWEQDHLQLPNGLFAYHWAKGKVVTHGPATDADLDTAWALVLAGTRFHDPVYRAQGLRVARSVLADETVTADGHLELVAGTWARKDPAIVDPSYLAPEAMAALASAGGGRAWRALQADSTALVRSLEDTVPTHLPSNWATLAPDGGVTPSGAGGKGPAAYGLDAQRVPVWFAADCAAGGRSVAGTAWTALRSAPDTGGRISYSVRGRPQSGEVNPLGYVAAAAAADAAGQRADAKQLLSRADTQNAAYHTYYGGAWVALGRILLDTTWLSSCPPG